MLVPADAAAQSLTTVLHELQSLTSASSRLYLRLLMVNPEPG